MSFGDEWLSFGEEREFLYQKHAIFGDFKSTVWDARVQKSAMKSKKKARHLYVSDFSF